MHDLSLRFHVERVPIKSNLLQTQRDDGGNTAIYRYDAKKSANKSKEAFPYYIIFPRSVLPRRTLLW